MAIEQVTAGELRSAAIPFRVKLLWWLRSSRLYLGVLGIVTFCLLWFLLVDVFKVWRFAELPKFVESVVEWFRRDPIYGMSLFTREYYVHIWASIFRVLIAFCLATVLGITIGILMGWRR